MSRCLQSRHENPADAKFCMECGRRPGARGVTSPQCTFENPPAMAFQAGRFANPNANSSARSTAVSFSGGKGPMGSVSARRGMVVIVSRFATQAFGKPSAGPSGTSVGIRRTRVVMGATVTSSRTA